MSHRHYYRPGDTELDELEFELEERLLEAHWLLGDDSSAHIAEWGTRVDDGAWHQVMMMIMVIISTMIMGMITTMTVVMIVGNQGRPGIRLVLLGQILHHGMFYEKGFLFSQKQNWTQ